MYNFFIIFPLPILIIGAYILNKRRDVLISGNIYIDSFFEALGAYFIIISILLEGFIANPLLKVLFITIGFIILAYSKRAFDGGEPDFDSMFETAKNLFVLFSSTFLMFFIMLSIFRFQPYYLQFLYAFLIVVLFNILTIFLKRIFTKIWDRIDFNVSMFVSFSSIYIYLGVFFVIFIIIFFNFPKVAVNQAINLNNSKSFFSFPNGSVELSNRYKADLLFDLDKEDGIDNSTYMNQDEDHIFIYVHDEVMIYDINQNKLVYSGEIQAQIDGIDLVVDNQELSEIKFQTHCQDEEDCNLYDYPFSYGDVVYKTYNKIYIIEDLEYEFSDTLIFTEEILHFFENQKIDSRIDATKDRPFIGFNDSTATVSDVDNYDGSITYLQIDGDEDYMNIKVYQVVEKDIDVELPFYSHYRFGILFFVFLLGFIPITNYDIYRR